MIETNDELAAFVAHLLKQTPEMAEMYRSYLTCLSGAVDKLFWIYEVSVDDRKEWWMDYQFHYGGGWLTVTVPYRDFTTTLDIMFDKWKLPKDIKKDLQVRKQCLMEYFNRVITEKFGGPDGTRTSGTGTPSSATVRAAKGSDGRAIRRNRKTKTRHK